MNKLKVIDSWYLSLLICLIVMSCKDNDAVIGKSGSLIIHDFRGAVLPEIDLSRHKPGDVVIWRTVDISEVYRVRYFQIEHDTLMVHSSDYITDEDFDQGFYKWKSDTSLFVSIKNSKSGLELRFNIFGFESRNSMITE